MKANGFKRGVIRHGTAALILVFFGLLALGSGGGGQTTGPAVREDAPPVRVEFSYKTESISTTECVIVGYNGDLPGKNLSLPGEIQGKIVVAIGEAAFRQKNLASVVIPDSVTSIAKNAFDDNRLTSVTIGNGVTEIGEGAFSHNELASVVIPDSVTSIGENAFYGNKLTSVVIPDNVTSIGDHAFVGNDLTSVTIGKSFTKVEGTPFESGATNFSRNKITSISLGDNMRNELIGDFEVGFRNFYAYNQRKAGTYIKSGEYWTQENTALSAAQIEMGNKTGSLNFIVATAIINPAAYPRADLFKAASAARDVKDGVLRFSSDLTFVRQDGTSIYFTSDDKEISESMTIDARSGLQAGQKVRVYYTISKYGADWRVWAIEKR